MLSLIFTHVIFCSVVEPSLCDSRYFTRIKVIKILLRSAQEQSSFKALYLG